MSMTFQVKMVPSEWIENDVHRLDCATFPDPDLNLPNYDCKIPVNTH